MCTLRDMQEQNLLVLALQARTFELWIIIFECADQCIYGNKIN